MKIKQLLENKYPTNLSDKILNYEVGNCCVKEIPNNKCKLFEGVELHNFSENKIIILNFEENEFSKLTEITFDKNGHIIQEIGYDENLTIEYINK